MQKGKNGLMGVDEEERKEEEEGREKQNKFSNNNPKTKGKTVEENPKKCLDSRSFFLFCFTHIHTHTHTQKTIHRARGKEYTFKWNKNICRRKQKTNTLVFFPGLSLGQKKK